MCTGQELNGGVPGLVWPVIEKLKAIPGRSRILPWIQICRPELWTISRSPSNLNCTVDLLHCAAHYLSFQSALNQYMQHSEEGALCVSSTGALDGFRCYIFAVKISTAESLCSTDFKFISATLFKSNVTKSFLIECANHLCFNFFGMPVEKNKF